MGIYYTKLSLWKFSVFTRNLMKDEKSWPFCKMVKHALPSVVVQEDNDLFYSLSTFFPQRPSISWCFLSTYQKHISNAHGFRAHIIVLFNSGNNSLFCVISYQLCTIFTMCITLLTSDSDSAGEVYKTMAHPCPRTDLLVRLC